jgi:YbgC/YbaW family acyl-CoA thioester hydrolase
MTAGIERRQYERFDLNLPLNLQVAGRNTKFSAVTKNISEGGIRLEWDPNKDNLPLMIWPDTKLRVNLPLPNQNIAIDTDAEITWIKKNHEEPSGKFDLGVRFEGIDEHQKQIFQSFIREIASARKKTFTYDKTVYLTDTNMEGNVYFARYFDWQGQAREAFYRQNFPLSIWQAGLKLITVNANIDYKHETFLFDDIQIKVQTSNLKNMSIELVFTYSNKNTGVLVAEGRQKIAFGSPDGKLIPMPEEIKKIAAAFSID